MKSLPILLAASVALAGTPREQLISNLNSIGYTQLAARAHVVAGIETRAAAEQRKTQVRAKILQLIGGLPERHEPLVVKQSGTLQGDGFRIEKIIFESLPGFYVTANVYLPVGRGPFPAVLLSPGHSPAGKIGEYTFGANFARNGIVALAYDPLGQGERLQHYDAALKDSKVGRPTGEHAHASIQTMVIGEHVSRYFIWDAMRGIDYLTSRADVQADRIGAFGCSGGGAVTAYLEALDPRVSAAASACYITSFQELLPTAGPQEAEQTIPNFVAEGLDFGDWVELAAPKPYAIVSTTSDMFPIKGAGQTFDEVKRIYALYGAADRVQWIQGPGGHGALGPIAPDILAFFLHWLKGSDVRPAFVPLRPERPQDLLCTSTGQVSTALGSENVYSINRKRAAVLRTKSKNLQEDIRELANVTVNPGSPPPAVTVLTTTERPGYRLETISLQSENGIALPGTVAIPKRAGAKPAILLLDPRPEEFERLALNGSVVFALQPRPSPAGTEEKKSPLLGNFYLLSIRAMLVGKNIVGMRIDDTLRAVDWLCARPDVDRSAISAQGYGPLGVVLLHAAVLDKRIGKVTVENMLASWRMIVEQPLHRDVSEVIIPGVLRKYDIPDLIAALGPQRVIVVKSIDAWRETAADPD
jgi:hypothetical protein